MRRFRVNFCGVLIMHTDSAVEAGKMAVAYARAAEFGTPSTLLDAEGGRRDFRREADGTISEERFEGP